MDLLVIAAAALCASGLTLFSGFGLGTLLLPVFALFFPVDLAIALTAIVHLLNNVFKLALLGRHTDRQVLLRFGIPAMLAAAAGAALLVWLSDMTPVMTWEWSGRMHDVHPVNLVIAVLMIGFAVVELSERGAGMQFGRRYLALGGLVSGFFGGLSGHQGALRSAFLVRAGLSREAFIATGVSIACMIDVTRLGMYAGHFSTSGLHAALPALVTGVLSAFAGAWIGTRLMKKVTMRGVQRLVAVLLVLIALALGTGVI